MTKPRNIVWGSKGYSDIFCVSFKIISLAPMRLLKTHFFEKRAALPVKKCVDLLLSRNIQHEKPQETIHSGSQCVKFLVQVK